MIILGKNCKGRKINDENIRNRRAHPHLEINYETSGTNEPQGISPSQIYSYYNFQRNYTGSGKTIAIIDAYYYPTVVEDLAVFSSTFSLPQANIQVFYPQGQPTTNVGWSIETALDTQWAHTMAPDANIMVVFAQDSSFGSLFDAVDFAVENGADIVSMSWGSEESFNETELEESFIDTGVIFVASAGDVGGVTEFPSASSYVISVGGTRLNTNIYGEIISETAWRNSGGGPSAIIPMPSWQINFGLEDLAGDYRATPDVAFNASPLSGVSIFHTNPNTGNSNWMVVGGTSLAAPSWAGIIASAFTNYRNTRNVSRLLYYAAGETAYTNPYNAFNDITTGSAGNFTAMPGYDFITGLGSPNIRNLIRILR